MRIKLEPNIIVLEAFEKFQDGMLCEGIYKVVLSEGFLKAHTATIFGPYQSF